MGADSGVVRRRRFGAEFDGDAVGFGGSLSLDPVVGDPSYVTGSVVLDRDFFADPADQSYLNEAVLHEFGHVMGLDHVSDGAQIMWSGGLHGSGLGSGDRAGLARLGRGALHPRPLTPPAPGNGFRSHATERSDATGRFGRRCWFGRMRPKPPPPRLWRGGRAVISRGCRG